MHNAVIKEPEKTNFFNWIINSPIDSEIIKYLNWIGDIPTGRFLIDQRTGYFHKEDYKNKVHIEKAYKKISVALIKKDWEFYEIEAEKKFNFKVS